MNLEVSAKGRGRDAPAPEPTGHDDRVDAEARARGVMLRHRVVGQRGRGGERAADETDELVLFVDPYQDESSAGLFTQQQNNG